jgi:prepilin-type processing-associated H-X9-DG protein
MLLPALAKAKGKAKQTQCINNLKQVGLVTLLYANDHQELVQISSPLDTKFAWGALLYTNQSVGSQATFRCPAYPPTVYTNWFCTFGVWSDPPDIVLSGSLKENLRVTSAPAPADYPHLADTTSRGHLGLGGVQYYNYRTNTLDSEVQARHNGAADGWFLDGHAEAMKKARMDQLGINALYGADTIPAYFGP